MDLQNESRIENPGTPALLHRLIGKGSYGKVTLQRTNGEYFAIKTVKFQDKNNKNAKKYFDKEVELHYNLEHKNIIEFHHYNDFENFGEICLEFADKGDLFEYISNNEITSSFFLEINLQIAEALKYLSENKIVHADIKPENTLLKSSGNSYLVKLCDFGFSCKLQDNQNQVNINQDTELYLIRKPLGTYVYMAPEIVAKGRFSYASDIYAFGVLMFRMLEKKYLFSPIYAKIIKNLLYYNNTKDNFSPETYLQESEVREEFDLNANEFQKIIKALTSALKFLNTPPQEGLLEIVRLCISTDYSKRLKISEIKDKLSKFTVSNNLSFFSGANNEEDHDNIKKSQENFDFCSVMS